MSESWRAVRKALPCVIGRCAQETPALLGEYMHPEVSMHTHPLREYMVHIRSGKFSEVAALMLSSAEKLASTEAQYTICPDNTIHHAFNLIAEASIIPWLHIAEVVAGEAGSRGFNTLAIIGTNCLMTGPVYPSAMQQYGIGCRIPDEAKREQIDRIVFSELGNGIFQEKSRLYFNFGRRLLASQGTMEIQSK